MAKYVNINGVRTEAPRGAIAWKYADPIEDARWVFDRSDLEDIERDDPSLIEHVSSKKRAYAPESEMEKMIGELSTQQVGTDLSESDFAAIVSALKEDGFPEDPEDWSDGQYGEATAVISEYLSETGGRKKSSVAGLDLLASFLKESREDLIPFLSNILSERREDIPRLQFSVADSAQYPYGKLVEVARSLEYLVFDSLDDAVFAAISEAEELLQDRDYVMGFSPKAIADFVVVSEDGAKHLSETDAVEYVEQLSDEEVVAEGGVSEDYDNLLRSGDVAGATALVEEFRDALVKVQASESHNNLLRSPYKWLVSRGFDIPRNMPPYVTIDSALAAQQVMDFGVGTFLASKDGRELEGPKGSRWYRLA